MGERCSLQSERDYDSAICIRKSNNRLQQWRSGWRLEINLILFFIISSSVPFVRSLCYFCYALAMIVSFFVGVCIDAVVCGLFFCAERMTTHGCDFSVEINVCRYGYQRFKPERKRKETCLIYTHWRQFDVVLLPYLPTACNLSDRLV